MNKYVNTDKKTGVKFIVAKNGKRFDLKISVPTGPKKKGSKYV